jgi:hypothetical protein
MKTLTILLLSLLSQQVLFSQDTLKAQNQSILRVSAGFDIPRIFSDGSGPFHFDTHYFLNRHLAFGFNYDFQRSSVSRKDLVYSDEDTAFYADYSGPLKTNQFLIEGIYYLDFPDSQSRFLRKWKIYTSLGLGIGIQSSVMNISAQTLDAPERIRTKTTYFVPQFMLGTEYLFRNHLGVFIEIGYGLSVVHGGLFYKL